MSEALLLQGKRGSGKSKFAVLRIGEYLRAGRTVATNLNIWPEHLAPSWCKTTLFRLPDFPASVDLERLPLGNRYLERRDGQVVMLPGYREEANGLLVLDEAATFLNSRSWNDKTGDRQEVIKWLLQSRKFGWDLIMIAQHQRLLDAQVRDSLFELTATVRRLDKMAIPWISGLLGHFGIKLKFPKLHICTVRYGFSGDAPIADRVLFRGSELEAGYDTLQKIDPAVGVKTGEGYTVLSPWLLRGRYMSKFRMFRGLIILSVLAGLILGSAVTWVVMSSHRIGASMAAQAQKAKPKEAADMPLAKGYFVDGSAYKVVMPDGSVSAARTFEETGDGWVADVNGIKVHGGAK